MSNALITVFKKDDVNTLQENIADLKIQKNTLQERIAGNERTRAENALAASNGDPDAQEALGRANTDRYDLDLRLNNLNLARAEAEARLADAEENIATAAKKERGAKINTLLKDRLVAAKEAEKLLLELTGVFDRMDKLASEVVEAHKEFRVIRTPEGSPISDERRLWPAAMSERLNEAVHRIGLRQYFDPLFRLTTIPAQNIIDIKLAGGYAAGERKAHRDYEI